MNIVGCRPGIIVFLIMTPYRFPHYDTLSFNRHSEQWQKCLVGKTGNRMVTPNGNHMLRLLTHSSQLIADSFYLLTAFPQHKNRPIICMDRFFCWDQRVPVVLSRVSARWRASLARSTSISLLLDASLSSARFFAAWARAISMVSASSAKGATIFT